MIRVALRSLAQRRLRSFLTAMSIVLGVAMIAGALMQTDRVRAAFDDMSRTSNHGTAVVVQARRAFTAADGTPRPTVDAALPDRLRGVEGVARVAGRVEERGTLVVRGRAVAPGGAMQRVLSAVGAPFDPLHVVRGRVARRAGEVVVDRALAADHGLRVGDRLGLSTRSGVRSVVLSGIADGDAAALAGGDGLVVARLSDVQRWYGREGRVTQVLVAANPKVSDATVARRVAAVLPADVEARTGAAEARQAADAAADAIGSFLDPALLALAGAALLVGAFIIFNTFSITVAQRTREFALLRALGATRREILGGVIGEAAIVGVAASVVGVLVGLGVAGLVGMLVDAAGLAIPSGGLVLAPRTVVVSLVVGAGVTLLAASLPAVRATRVSPMAAMRVDPSPESAGPGRLRSVLSVGVVLGGTGLLLTGVLVPGTSAARDPALAAGALLLFLGVALLARHVVGPLAAAIGWPLALAFDEPGRLARENATRSPARTASSAATLMVGLALVVFVAVLATSLKGSIGDSLSDRMRADVIVTGNGQQPLPAATDAAVRGVPSVRAVAPYRVAEIRVGGAAVSTTTDSLNGMDPATLLDVYAPRWVAGSDAAVAKLRGDRALVEEQFAQQHGLRVGQRFTVEAATGRRRTFVATAIYRDPMLLHGVIVAAPPFAALVGRSDAFGYFAAAQPGAAGSAVVGVTAAVARVAPAASVESRGVYRRSVEHRIDTFASLLYALLAMSVLVALVGIVNSLFLAVFERTREFGLLRAVGATQHQVRRVVRYESVITAVIGALLGTAVGILFALVSTVALEDLGLRMQVPVLQLLGFVAVAVVVGVLGAVLPARRAAAVDVLTAMRDD